MIPDFLSEIQLNDFISAALAEDIGSGDHSTLATIRDQQQGKARLLIKGDGVVAGLQLAKHIFFYVDPLLDVKFHFTDGDSIKKGDVVFHVHGSLRSILTSERLVLNCLQRMSGIATRTARYVKLLKGTKTSLLDTRKTTPNFRAMEKWAVAIGGGKNHRFKLSDLILLKDNHIDASGGVREAIRSARAYRIENSLTVKIEVETRTLSEVEQALDENPDIIMLDNMTADDMRAAVRLIDGRCEVEASGGINEYNIAEVAKTGVDFISVGELTHHIQSLDMSLKIEL